MGMLDNELILSSNQAVSGTNTDVASSNFYNTGGANGQGDNGQTGENLWVTVRSLSAATGAGSTVQAVLQDSADGTTFADVTSGPATGVANVTISATLLQVQPPPGMRQYWRIVYRITGTLTASSFDAYVSNTIQRNTARPSGIPKVL